MAKLYQWAAARAVKTAGNESAVHHAGLGMWPGQDQLA